MFIRDVFKREAKNIRVALRRHSWQLRKMRGLACPLQFQREAAQNQPLIRGSNKVKVPWSHTAQQSIACMALESFWQFYRYWLTLRAGEAEREWMALRCSSNGIFQTQVKFSKGINIMDKIKTYTAKWPNPWYTGSALKPGFAIWPCKLAISPLWVMNTGLGNPVWNMMSIQH